MSEPKKAIVLAFPGYEELYKISKPSIDVFAARHNYDVLAHTNNPTDLPASWGKIPHLINTFEAGYDIALWLDVDLIIVDPSDDVTIPESMHQGLAQHISQDGTKTVNCGVWYLKKEALPFLHEVWKTGPVEYANPLWWEQNAVLHVLGISVFPPHAIPEQPNTYLQNLFELDYSWNTTVFDRRNFYTTSKFRILHAAGCGSIARRADIMRRWVHQLGVDKLK